MLEMLYIVNSLVAWALVWRGVVLTGCFTRASKRQLYILSIGGNVRFIAQN